MQNPALPLTRLNRIAADNGLDAIQIDSPITFQSAAHRAALKTELTLSDGVIAIAGQAARFALPGSTPAGQIVKDSLGVKMAGTITAIAEDGSFLFDDGIGHASVGKSLTAVNAAGDALWVFYLRVAGVGTAPTKRAFATKAAGSFTCVAESAGNFDAGGGIGVDFYTTPDGSEYDIYYLTVGGIGDAPDFGPGDFTYVPVNVTAGANATAVAVAVRTALNLRSHVSASNVAGKVSWEVSAAGAFAGAVDNENTPFDFFADGYIDFGQDAVEWEVAPTFVPVNVAAAATATAVAAALAAAIAGSTCPATATAAVAVVSYVADASGPLPALIANIETGFTFSAPTAGIAATGAIFALIDPPALATAAGWMRHGVTGRVLFAALATIHQQTLTNATWTAFHYDSAQSNLGGAMNLATGNWTAPEAMVVQINAAIRVDNQTNNVPPVRNDLRVLKNGVEYCRLYSVPALHPSATISITVAAGDVIALQAFCFSFGLAIEAYTLRDASVVQIVQSQ